MERALKKDKKTPKARRVEMLGLIFYWRGLISSKLHEYPNAIENFEKSIRLKYKSDDMYYEYAQALYAQEELKKSRRAFRASVKNKYKMAVSLYYMAYLSQVLKDYKKSVAYYSAIERLDDNEEKSSVLQAARMQIGDIYLMQAEKLPNAFRAVDKHVIPQYEEAWKFDKTSDLGKQIKKKIEDLQRKYELVLFRMRNGRPTLRPPYFLRLVQAFNYDSNINAVTDDLVEDTDNTLDTWASATTFLGRYTFYVKDVVSVAPEARLIYTKHLTDEDYIYTNDNYSANLAIRNTYEHMLFGKQASLLFDFDNTRTVNDTDENSEADRTLELSSTTNTFMLGERFVYGSLGETVLRYRSGSTVNENSEDYSNSGFTWEQVFTLFRSTLLITMITKDQTRYEETDTLDTDAMTYRVDFIPPRLFGFATVSYGLSMTNTDYINDDDKGPQTTLSPSLTFTRTIGYGIRGNVTWGQTVVTDAEEDANNYNKTTYGFNLEYVF
ncbi:tetratricopeptide repeat protein [Bacteriovoracaceae bacterium]|nr:tetratricopeptide repeat protein [Bacteriovoracaceae bacterium]